MSEKRTFCIRLKHLSQLLTFVFLSLFVVGCGAKSQELASTSETNSISLDDAMIKAHIDSLLEATNGVSIAVAVGYENDLIYQAQRGYQSLEDSSLVDEGALYRIGSTSKVLASTLLFKYLEQGKVDLNDSIQRFIPAFPAKKFPFNIGHILTHTSGIRHYNGHFPQDRARHTRDFKTFSEAMSLFKDDSLLFEPGTKWHYTSYGFNLIQGILEQVSGKKIEQLMADEVFGPLQMNSSLVEVYGDRPEDLIKSYAWEQVEKRIIPARPGNPSYKKVAGGMVSTAPDLVRFLMGVDNEKIISKSAFDAMMEVPFKEVAPWQAYGWRYGERSNGMVLYHHGGTSRGFISYIVMVPSKKIYVAVVANYTEFNDVRSSLANFLIDHTADKSAASH